MKKWVLPYHEIIIKILKFHVENSSSLPEFKQWWNQRTTLVNFKNCWVLFYSHVIKFKENAFFSHISFLFLGKENFLSPLDPPLNSSRQPFIRGIINVSSGCRVNNLLHKVSKFREEYSTEESDFLIFRKIFSWTT